MSELKAGRLVSLDAYRGLIMLTLAASGFGLLGYANNVLKEHPDSQIWQFVKFQTDHPAWHSDFNWVGVSYWDLIQPSFMFMVGVAMPFSYSKRLTRGDSYGKMTLHALFRSIALILLGVFLESTSGPQTRWSFVCVLSQIGLGYMLVYFLLGMPNAVKLLAGIAMLAGYWYWFVHTPVPSAGSMENFAEHFGKNENAAAYLDRTFLNWFPPHEFKENTGGYATLNFVPSMVTMLLGVMCGELLQGDRREQSKLVILFAGGAVLMALGLAAGHTVCPIVKRIWTPSWVLFSGAYCLWILGAFYAVIDVVGFKRLAFPLVVLGVNSILLYLMGQLLRPWVVSQLDIHFGMRNLTPGWLERALEIQHGQSIFSGPYSPITRATGAMAVFWLICLWLYRQRLFIRI
jgi:predicted acyltransferase